MVIASSLDLEIVHQGSGTQGTGQELAKIFLDAAVIEVSVHDDNIAIADAIGRMHVFKAAELLSDKPPYSPGGNIGNTWRLKE